MEIRFESLFYFGTHVRSWMDTLFECLFYFGTHPYPQPDGDTFCFISVQMSAAVRSWMDTLSECVFLFRHTPTSAPGWGHFLRVYFISVHMSATGWIHFLSVYFIYIHTYMPASTAGWIHFLSVCFISVHTYTHSGMDTLSRCLFSLGTYLPYWCLIPSALLIPNTIHKLKHTLSHDASNGHGWCRKTPLIDDGLACAFPNLLLTPPPTLSHLSPTLCQPSSTFLQPSPNPLPTLCRPVAT